MRFDDIFDLTGQFGRFQAYACSLIFMFSFWSYHGTAVPFVVFPMDHWCSVPGLENVTWDQQKYIGIPSDESGSYDKCKRFDADFSKYTTEELLSWNRSSMSLLVNQTVFCSSWVYNDSEYHSSAVMKFDLVCGREWLVSLASTTYLFGAMLGTFTCGILSDRFGRRITAAMCNILVAISGTVCAFAPNYVTFSVGRFLAGLGRIAVFAIGTVHILELVGKKYRAAVGIGFGSGFAVGYCIMPWMAKGLQSDVYFQLALSLPSILYVSYIWILPESPRWLLVNRKYKEAEKALQWIARWNGHQLDPSFDVRDIDVEDSSASGNGALSQWFKTLSSVMKSKILRRRLWVVFFVWFTIVLQYFAVALNVALIPGDIYLNTFLIALMELGGIPAIFLANSPYFGRKRTMILCILATGICGFLSLFLMKYDQDTALLVVILIGRLTLTAAFNLLYVYTTELFPTELRNTTLGAASTVGRISGMIAAFVGGPMQNVFWALPNIIYGVMCTTAGLLCFLLPETLNKQLPDTVEEAEMHKYAAAVGENNNKEADL